MQKGTPLFIWPGENKQAQTLGSLNNASVWQFQGPLRHGSKACVAPSGGGGGSGGAVSFSACTLTAGLNATIEAKGGTGGQGRNGGTRLLCHVV